MLAETLGVSRGHVTEVALDVGKEDRGFDDVTKGRSTAFLRRLKIVERESGPGFNTALAKNSKLTAYRNRKYND